MTTTHEQPVAVEPATTEALADCAVLLAPSSSPPNYTGIQAQGWATPFRAGDPVALLYMRFGWQEPVFSKLERHRGVTQTFIALAPRAFVTVVAPATPPGIWPAPETVRAVLVPPGQGIIIGEGVWHALDRFLLEPEPLDCAMLTSAAVQAELEAHCRGGPAPRRTDVVDFAERGLSFRLALPPA